MRPPALARFALASAVALGLGPTVAGAQDPAKSGSESTATPPNVVLILSDDQAWGDYGFMGHPHLDTPHLDQLAAEGMTFTRGYVPSSLCRPSLVSIITGLHPRQHKVVGNDPALALKRHPEMWASANHAMDERITEIDTLPRRLGAELGYVSLQTGKWWEGTPEAGGFTRGMTHGDPERGGRHGDAGLKIGRDGLEPAYDFVRSAKADGKPFFLWYAPFLPHSPHNPPERLLEKYRDLTDSVAVARYWAMVEWFDETCGDLLGFLDSEGLRENTIVVYVCDNGWIQDPDRPNRYAERSKRSPYDGGLRTPIIVHWPGHTKPRTDTGTPVLSTDIAPTVLAACGLEPSDGMGGVDLLDANALAGRGDTVSGAVYLHNINDLDNPVSSLTHRWIVDGDYKVISPFKPNAPGGTTQLFNVTNDPHELEDLAGTQPDRLQSLVGKLDAWYPLPKH